MKICAGALGLLAVASVAHAQATPQQFDLECVGRAFTGNTADLVNDKGWHPYRITYRIDLDSNRWCSNQCEQTSGIRLVTRTSIVLVDVHSTLSDRSTEINRETGKLSGSTGNSRNDYMTIIEADCTPHPFSGFPALKF